MRRRSTLLVVILVSALPGCGAGASQGDATLAELEARSARAEAARERARLIAVEKRLLEVERRYASRMSACEETREPRSSGIANTDHQPKPLRSEGDFLAEARIVPSAATPPAATASVKATPQEAKPGAERERLQLLLEALREYAFDPGSGLSRERREALRVLLRPERKLDLMNPWRDP